MAKLSLKELTIHKIPSICNYTADVAFKTVVVETFHSCCSDFVRDPFISVLVYATRLCMSCTVWVKKSPRRFSDIFPKRLGIFNQFFTHLLYVPIYARLQIIIQLSPTFTKLSHTKRDHPSNFFLHFTRTQLHCWLMSYPFQHVCWHCKSSRSGMTCHRKRSTKLSTTVANVWRRAFRPMVDILSILRELRSRA